MREKYLKMKTVLLAMMTGVLVTGCKSKDFDVVSSFRASSTIDKLADFSEELQNDLKMVHALAELNQIKEEESKKKTITISAIGDCTLGADLDYGFDNSFYDVHLKNEGDNGYFFAGVRDILENDDLTIANLETTFTDASSDYKVDKKFNFKGLPSYTKILEEGSVEVVNVANNHTYDYGEVGYNATLENLSNAAIPYFGYDNYQIMDVEGIKVGLAGVLGWSEDVAKENTKKAIDYFKENETDLIVISYHWGIEREPKQNGLQENIARYAVDLGADLILGHHPHVLQGIEVYNGKYIVYSLGNFVFGGNKNPGDKDTMIFQQEFCFEGKDLVDSRIKIIPCSLSSRVDKNDYQPQVLDGEEEKRVKRKILDSSTNFIYDCED